MTTLTMSQERFISSFEKSKSLYADGYRARVVDTAESFITTSSQSEAENLLFQTCKIVVRTPAGTLYTISPTERTCTCPATKPCKHILGLIDLLKSSAQELGKKSYIAKKVDCRARQAELLLGKANLITYVLEKLKSTK